MELSQGQVGALRVALNLNNNALVQRARDGYTGVAIRLAERIGAAMSRPLAFVAHPNAKSVVQAAPEGWDIAFLAIDPSRAELIAFSDPYHRVEATFAVREALPPDTCPQILQGEYTILSAKGVAYQARLSALAPQGPLIVASSPDEARERFLRGEGDALAGIRQTLSAAPIPRTRLLADSFAQIEQAVAVPLRAKAQLAVINRVLGNAG